jgi:CRP/FNR family transcriptional regulator/CRP/FNR family cyclic AMP-dependent transcriptional regulator
MRKAANPRRDVTGSTTGADEANASLTVHEIVRKVPLFVGLQDSDVGEIADIAHFKSYPKDHLLFDRGEEGDEFLVVIQGRLKIIFLNEDGRELTLTILSPYQTLGEMSLIDDYPRSASAVALGDLHVLSINKRDFRKVLETNPRIAMGLLRQMSRRLRELTEDTAGLIFMDVYQRLARKLLNLSQTLGVEREGGREIPQRLTHQELANMIGATRETVTKVLNEMETRSIISFDKKRVRILNEAELEVCTLKRFQAPGSSA